MTEHVFDIRNLGAVKHRVFISYHHGGDQSYYNAFSNAFHDKYDIIYDNSLERGVESDNVDYIMRRIRENYITGSSCTIVLCGALTGHRKYVDWEIRATLEKSHGLIGVELPTAQRDINNRTLVPGRLHDNIVSGFALWKTWADITASAVGLERYIADAKSRSLLLIDNSRVRLQRNS